MSKGMEMMISAAVKALGIDPKVLMATAENFMGQVSGKVREFDVRLYDLENQNAQLIAQNQQFLGLLKQAYPDALPVTKSEVIQNESEQSK